MKENKKGIGLTYAIQGIVSAFIHERNFRIHIIIAICVIGGGFFFKLTRFEWLFVLISILLVLMTELINSNVERIIDYIKPEYHVQAKIIKDIAAGTVLLAAVFAVIVGLIIFIPNIPF